MFETFVTVVGNIVTPPKGFKLEKGDTGLHFRMASNERRRNGPGGEWGPGRSFFIRVKCWRQLAENALVSLNVGDPVIVRGRLYTDEYAWEGETRTEMLLEAVAIGPDLSRSTAEITRTRRKTATAEEAAAAESDAEETVDAGESTALHPTGERYWPADPATELVGAASGPAAEYPDGDRPSDDELDRLVAGAEAAVGV